MKLLTLLVSVFLVFQHSITQITIVQATRSTNFCGNDTSPLLQHFYISVILNGLDKSFFHSFLLKETDVMFPNGTQSRELFKSGTHVPEPTAPILGLFNGIFTDRSIFRLSFPEKTKAVPVR